MQPLLLRKALFRSSVRSLREKEGARTKPRARNAEFRRPFWQLVALVCAMAGRTGWVGGELALYYYAFGPAGEWTVFFSAATGLLTGYFVFVVFLSLVARPGKGFTPSLRLLFPSFSMMGFYLVGYLGAIESHELIAASVPDLLLSQFVAAGAASSVPLLLAILVVTSFRR